MALNETGSDARAQGGQAAGHIPAVQEAAIYATTVFTHAASKMVFVAVPLWAVMLETPPLLLGFVIGAWNLPSLLLSIPGGALMDRMGARRLMIFFAMTMMICTALYPALPWVVPLIALQMVAGFSTSMTWIGAQTVLAQAMRGSASHAGRITVSAHVGSFIGPVIAGIAWDVFGPWGAFLLISAICALIIASVSLMPATTTGNRPEPSRKRDMAPRLADYRDAFKLMALPAVTVAICASILDHASAGMRNSFYVVWLNDFGLTGTAIGMLLSITSVAAAGTAFFAGWPVRYVRDTWVLLTSFAFGIALIAITPLLGTFVLLFVVAALRGGILGFGHPLALSMVSRAVSDQDQGKAVGLRITGNRISDTFTPIAMGAAVEIVGIENSFYVVGGVLLVLIGLLALHARRADPLGESG